jgi:hypothetical protein
VVVRIDVVHIDALPPAIKEIAAEAEILQPLVTRVVARAQDFAVAPWERLRDVTGEIIDIVEQLEPTA